MKLEISKEWCLRAADAEGNHEVGVGAPAMDDSTSEPTVTITIRKKWRERIGAIWMLTFGWSAITRR